MPNWLFDLLSVWNARRVKVITLNYDTMIERNIARHALGDKWGRDQVTQADVLDDLPVSQGGSLVTGIGKGTMQLLKLHGSTSWFWVSNDPTGSTIRRWDPVVGQKDNDPTMVAERRRLLPGRSPFIIPPVTAKSSLYNNPLTREIWTRSYEAIRRADRLFFIGYSFPPTDGAVRGLIANALDKRNPHAAPLEAQVIDRVPGPVQQRLAALGMHVTSPETSVEKFTDAYIDEAARDVIKLLRRWQPSPDIGWLRVVWGPTGSSHFKWIDRITVRKQSRTLYLHAEEDEAGTKQTPPLLSSLLANAQHIDRMVFTDGKTSLPIVDYLQKPDRNQPSDPIGSWRLVLFPVRQGAST